LAKLLYFLAYLSKILLHCPSVQLSEMPTEMTRTNRCILVCNIVRKQISIAIVTLPAITWTKVTELVIRTKGVGR